MRAITLTLFYLFISWINAIGAIQYSHAEFKPKGVHYTTKYNLIYNYYTSLTTDRIIILYFKNDKGVVLFKGLQVSENLKVLLPDLVIKYIGKQVTDAKMKETHSLEKVVAATRIAVERALDQKYKNALLKEGAQLVLDSSYHRGYCNLNWWMPNYYYDFEPAFSKDSVNDFLLNKVEDKEFKYLNYIAKELKSLNYHHDYKALSKWPDKVMEGSGTILSGYKFSSSAIKSVGEYHINRDSCRFNLKKATISHGKKYPRFASISHFGWYATYCNFFASDLQSKIFGTKLWSTNGCGNDMIYLQSKKDFVRIPKDKVKDYSQVGYFVFLIKESHISTIFPDNPVDLKVVQAGNKTGIFEVANIWGKNYSTDPEVYAYLYLGYLNK